MDLSKEIILIGDFNVNWDDKKDRQNLKRITDNFNLEQLVEKPTRITGTSQTRIDLIFSNKHNRIELLADHNIIFFTRKMNKKTCFSKAHRLLSN